MRIELSVNGILRSVDTGPMTRLLDILREDLGLTGTKEGCGEGECGACSVIMDGRLVTSCLIPAIQAAGSEILTVEGIGTAENPSLLQTVFNEEGAVHCGFCVPGMVVAAHDLLEKTRFPDLETTRRALSGNICRCTGYGKIYNAVARAAREGYGNSLSPRVNFCKNKKPLFSPEEAERYFSPATLREALVFLGRHPNITVLAGATDIAVDLYGDRSETETAGALDIFSLPELRTVYEGDDGCLHIGACVTTGELENNPTVRNLLPSLTDCAAFCGGPAIQNRATIGGNLCTASGAGDLPVVLLALDASLVLADADGEQLLKSEDFTTGYRKTALRPGQLLKEILIPLPAAGSRQAFFKRGSRKALTLSRASLAVFLEHEENKVKTLRIAAGSMSPVPRRLKETESALTGEPLNAALAEKAARLASEEISPRRQSAYRKNITGNLVRRFFEKAAEMTATGC